MGIASFDNKNLIDPSYLEKKVKVTYGLQKVGQTMVIPSGWTYWIVRGVR